MDVEYSELLDEARASSARVRATVAGMTEEQARAASLLPGWTRGHLVTHLARNADAMWRFARGVIEGRPVRHMYPGGPPARAAAIEEGAGRPVGLLRADLDFSASRALETMAAIPAERLGAAINWVRVVPARRLPALRWRELEVHHVDLGMGYAVGDWPDAFVGQILQIELDALEQTGWRGKMPELEPHDQLAWLLGRPTRAGLPTLPAWPF